MYVLVPGISFRQSSLLGCIFYKFCVLYLFFISILNVRFILQIINYIFTNLKTEKVIYIDDYGDHVEVPRATSVHLDLLQRQKIWLNGIESYQHQEQHVLFIYNQELGVYLCVHVPPSA